MTHLRIVGSYERYGSDFFDGWGGSLPVPEIRPLIERTPDPTLSAGALAVRPVTWGVRDMPSQSPELVLMEDLRDHFDDYGIFGGPAPPRSAA